MGRSRLWCGRAWAVRGLSRSSWTVTSAAGCTLPRACRRDHLVQVRRNHLDRTIRLVTAGTSTRIRTTTRGSHHREQQTASSSFARSPYTPHSSSHLSSCAALAGNGQGRGPGGGGGGKPGGGGGGSYSVTVDPVGPYHFGQQVWVTTNAPVSSSGPWIDLHCYQNGVKVYGNTHAGFASGWYYNWPFTLGPTECDGRRRELRGHRPVTDQQQDDRLTRGRRSPSSRSVAFHSQMIGGPAVGGASSCP